MQKSQFENPQALKAAIAAAQADGLVDTLFKNVHYLDVFSCEFVQGDVAVLGDKIIGVGPGHMAREEIEGHGLYVVPGFMDSHVHIESSLLAPSQFERAVLPCGTTTAMWDPHEIANVKGTQGIQWALDSTEDLLMDVFVMVPSCVPSTSSDAELETSGAVLCAKDIKQFAHHPRVTGLAEMMNFPGLLSGDDDVVQKMQDFQHKKRDGHCPNLSGQALNAYACAGVHSCHESTSLKEAKEKLRKGIHVLIREGSCAKDADALLPIINAYTSSECGLCSDDRNALDVKTEGHINHIINKALHAGVKPEEIFRVSSYSPARLYGLDDRGAVAPGYLADLVLCKPVGRKWTNGMSIHSVYKSGERVEPDALGMRTHHDDGFASSNIHIQPVTLDDIQVSSDDSTSAKVRVIGLREGQLLTDELQLNLPIEDGLVQSDASQGVAKIVVIERHHASGNLGVGFVKGFALKEGAIATTINHDSHNIIIVGHNDQAILSALKALKKIDGGIVVMNDKGHSTELILPIGGLMSAESPGDVATSQMALQKAATKIGCKLDEPFLQLSFLALPVIPSLKITDRGLVDVKQFKKVPVLV
jgi:adenine deaminase